MGSAYLGNTVHKFYSLGGKVIVNSTINLEDLPTTRNRNIRQTLQRQIIQVIQSHANNIGNSALWVDGPLNPVPDVSGMAHPSLLPLGWALLWSQVMFSYN